RLGLHDGQHVVEIGAGYGGLSAAVQKATNVRYTIIDLPETLLYSTCFLAEQFPDKRIYVYQPGDDASAQDGFDIVLLPNYRSEFLATCDVAINTVSFPEMRRADLDGYIDLLSDRLRPGGFLMSVNYENHVDGKTVCDHLERRFDQFPNRTEQVAIADECGMDPLHVNFRPTTVCVHKRSMPPIVELRDVIAGHRVKTDLRQSLRHDLGDDAVVVDSAAAGHRDNRLDRP
ncbi:MAG: putative sugar O-methyltransferase, partial [Pseudomonadota bacterium]